MIKNNDLRYKDIVELSKDKKNYRIKITKVESNEEVECPTDVSMTVKKISENEVIIKKKSRHNPFI